jgi:N-acetylmuramoyl-L-alanine amidase
MSNQSSVNLNKKIDVTMKACKPILYKLHVVIVILFITILAHFSIVQAKSNRLIFQIPEKTIVLDPGHGGYDKGAQGPEGTFEKSVAMEFAQVLALELNKTYHVILTRTDDYWVDILTRTAMANHQNADMFISIHTGGSFLHQASGMSLYYFEKSSKPALIFEKEAMDGPKNSNYNDLWSNIQIRHQHSSKVLSEYILNSLKEKVDEEVGYIADEQGAPLLVLEGADMPAILIELGYITNPKEEKSLNDINVLTDIAKRIKKGIDEYFEKAP